MIFIEINYRIAR